MKYILSTLLLFIGWAIQAQSVEVINKSQTWQAEKSSSFDFLKSSTDTSTLEYVATLSISGADKHAKIEALFYAGQKEAKKLGANAFIFKTHTEGIKPRKASLTLDLYFASDSILEYNLSNRDENTIYLFTGEKISDENHTIKVNDVKTLLKAGTYIKHQLKEGEQFKINIGGFLGQTNWFNWKENKAPVFLTLTQFGLYGAQIYEGPFNSGGAVGVGFNTGRIIKLPENLGNVLLQIMNEASVK